MHAQMQICVGIFTGSCNMSHEKYTQVCVALLWWLYWCWHIEIEEKVSSFRTQQFLMHFLEWKCMNFASYFTEIWFVPKVRINNIPALVQIMAWRSGDKPLSEPMMVNLLTLILGLNELTHMVRCWFTGTGSIVWWSQFHWSDSEGWWYIILGMYVTRQHMKNMIKGGWKTSCSCNDYDKPFSQWLKKDIA